MVSYIKILEELVDNKRTSFYTENFHAIDLAIKKLLKRLKDLKYIEQEHKEINGQLRERVKELEEENAALKKGVERLKHKSKIKEKIEEINIRIEKYREHIERGFETDIEWVDNVADRETVQVLQELLEEKEEI